MKTENDIILELGKNIEQARITRKLTQQELADRASVSRQTVAKIENGNSVNSLSLIRVIWAMSLEENLLKALSPEKDTLGRTLAFGSLNKTVRKRRNNAPEENGEFE